MSITLEKIKKYISRTTFILVLVNKKISLKDQIFSRLS